MRAEWTALAPLSGAALLAALTVLVSPQLPIANDALADGLAVLLAAGGALTALQLSSAGKWRLQAALGAGAVGLAILVVLYGLASGSPLTIPFQVFALLLVGRVLGGLIGERIQSPGHVLPATLVAAAADCASVFSPEGASNAIASNERTLAVFALAAAVPGTSAITYVLGVGDLVMIALLYGVARKFLGPSSGERSSTVARVTLALVAALVLAFGAAALAGLPIPALVPIALMVNLMVPEFRRVPRADRKAALVAAVLALGVVAFVALRSLLRGGL